MGAWPAVRDVPMVVIREAAGLVSAYVTWHLERGLRSLPLLEES